MKKKLLLHSCCAPCSSGVVPQLTEYDITLLFYNPNIDTIDEYNHRLATLKEYVDKYNKEFKSDLKLIAISYNQSEFLDHITNLENEKEGGQRCSTCIRIRLDFTGRFASENGYDLFASTLSVSPHKNYEIINKLGNDISIKYNVEYLPSNFKKNNGFLNSIENSKKYGLYRQNYCGCQFAKGHLNKKYQ